ncbi:conserved Plasmodium protein, unknown function [Plasmodium knowlesi strain H]|uniref:HIT-type domain-containing protein n=3 Tax=Plasmodium knowlesi TaxID=5850 RepID=A0A5K1USK9_PLAKH|nr:zinc finger protein, putative [Plasmodium knowlesi strain H]OTN67284.1 Uncharacterized protein PKNOH_S06416700 [Plasmodium knowlesi]CAA9987440.1 zinc finger protein, putative [Plasmodium knowlesi strain H]SBO23252.1 conserved Plasmodium protein, unknown function [Plasmodium knowlesi strain H]SBO24156.1 conserved Plasmodium protein, unknown function [Plasmodium knowlesi strain H]VVS76914.1 zinc finger protein, putative [Plasmodium knowlesi strain H]|eukprot:XP_002258441.1 hypothetical protein, conserved in Plasmodium species [Plasmodium knowlesi strain H]
MDQTDSNVKEGDSPTCQNLESTNDDDKIRRDKNNDSQCDPPLEEGTTGNVIFHAREKYNHLNRRGGRKKWKHHGHALQGDVPDADAPNNLSSLFGKKQKEQNICVVCLQNGVVKYKFVCCYGGYCSVACFQRHDKKACLEEQGKNDNKLNEVNNLEFQKYEHKKSQVDERGDNPTEDEEESDEDLLTEEQKVKLKEDIRLRILLKNNYVRSVFKNFTTSKDKIAYLSNYINDPTIVQVVDQIMKSVEG